MNALLNIFRSSGSSPASPPPTPATPRIPRRSSGFQEFSKFIEGAEGLTVLDLGPTSARNLTLFSAQGHRIYSEDVLAPAFDPALQRRGQDGATGVDVDRFLAENLIFNGAKFDAVLLWDIADYLPETLVKPMVERLAKVMNPGGVLLGFFHTRDAGSQAHYSRYHILGADTLEMQAVPRFRLQRVFNNRHIENLFHDFKSLKFFLARDYIREVLVVR